jgi:hypothetical protein
MDAPHHVSTDVHSENSSKKKRKKNIRMTVNRMKTDLQSNE